MAELLPTPITLPIGLDLRVGYQKPGSGDGRTEVERHRVWLSTACEAHPQSVSMGEAVAGLEDALRQPEIADRPNIAAFVTYMQSFHLRAVVDPNEGGKYSPFRLGPRNKARAIFESLKVFEYPDKADRDPIADLLGYRVGAVDLMKFGGHLLTKTALEGSQQLGRARATLTDPREIFLSNLGAQLSPQLV